MKKIMVIGSILISGFLFSCSNDDDQDMSVYSGNTELFGTGGEDEQTPPPPTLIEPEP